MLPKSRIPSALGVTPWTFSRHGMKTLAGVDHGHRRRLVDHGLNIVDDGSPLILARRCLQLAEQLVHPSVLVTEDVRRRFAEQVAVHTHER